MMKSDKIKGLLSTLGPGILFAGAAIGGSHLVQSTRAGANYGFTLMGLVALTLVLKYPFFQYSHRYAACTGKSLVDVATILAFLTALVFALLNFRLVSARYFYVNT